VETEPEPAAQQAPTGPEAEADVLEIARQALEELLDKMHISAQIQAQTRPPEEDDDLPRHILDIHGPDLGMLIGRRGETLDALQYLTRLIIGRELERRISLTVDVEGYRARRERTLRQLARRMAERTVATGRKSVLEPMPPAERRIVHMALRNHPDVTTESIGQGDKRKVTIILKKPQR
jgi:spoIIIJ-associated protein